MPICWAPCTCLGHLLLSQEVLGSFQCVWSVCLHPEGAAVPYSANTEAQLLGREMRTRTLGPKRAYMCRVFTAVGVGVGVGISKGEMSARQGDTEMETGLSASVCLAG